MARYKRKKPFIIRFFKGIFGFALVLGVAFCGLWGYLYFGKNVELVGAIGQVNALSTGVNEVEYVSNSITANDNDSITNKTQSSLSEDLIIYDREVGAFLNQKIQNGLSVNVGDSEIVLSDYNVVILETNFLSTNLPAPHLVDVNVKFKFDTSIIKNSFSSFPFSLLKDRIPETLYISITAEIELAEGQAQSYYLDTKEIIVNQLSAAESQNIFNLVAMATGLESSQTLTNQVAECFVKELLGTNSYNGLYQHISSHIPTGFESTFCFNNGEFKILLTPAKYSINVVQKIENTNNSNLAEIIGCEEEFIHGSNTTLNISANQGYKFVGWYTPSDILISQEEALFIQNITSDIVYLAKFEYITKTITYLGLLPNSTNPNQTTYNISYSNFTLNAANCPGYTFLGWWTGENGTGDKITQIDVQLLEDITLYAHWREGATQVSLNIYIDGAIAGAIEVDSGSTLTPQILSAQTSNLLLSGYTVENWYTNSSLTTPLSSTIITSNQSFYGNSTYFTDNFLFYPYKDIFDEAVENNSKLTFNNKNELLAWMDYAIYYHIVRDFNADGTFPTFTLNYFSGTPEQTMAEVNRTYEEDYAKLSRFQSIAYTPAIGNRIFFISPKTENISVMASKTADPDHTETDEQQDAALTISPASKRANTFNNFKINKVQKTIDGIFNSEQLVRALEQGYRPVCESGSSAETVYNIAKSVLREICDDNMTDKQKLQAIYEWLAINVQYDNKAVKITQGNDNETRKYKAWFSEGVFIDKMAVCEGFAKATIILAKIEGIPAVMETGNNHAWNKVLVDGTWYQFDATHGNITLTQKETEQKREAISYTTFLFGERPNYVGGDYQTITTTQSYDFYDNATFTYNNQTYDLKIDNQNELNSLFNYLSENFENNISSTYYSVEISLNNGDIGSMIYTAEYISGLNVALTYNTTNYLGTSTYLLLIEKTA